MVTSEKPISEPQSWEEIKDPRFRLLIQQIVLLRKDLNQIKGQVARIKNHVEGISQHFKPKR